ncbi:MAG: acetyl-CoA carboxylase biotin carboxyl carrier protein [Alphaproteobacteria bacterium]|nr:MAG: acetyl-CoA carboxylase biotin carboxyl carrier protein [Alphaproteobacteria bacterium]
MAPMKIDSEMIRSLAELLDETGLTEIEVCEGDKSLRVTRGQAVQSVVAAAPAAANVAAPQVVDGGAAAAAPGGFDSHPGAIKSPMVGTVYLQPEPGAPSFAQIGDTVKEGDTLMIIEAMKVMNPMKAPKSGKLVQVLVENAQPVEFDEVLMVIE